MSKLQSYDPSKDALLASPAGSTISQIHLARISAVHQILAAHVQQPLPHLEAIAHEVSWSLSTLKRHFKNSFGTSIYAYYLGLKMDLAKQMLIEKPLTVNEVAGYLDYEKTSNFIRIFKKYHGCSPGSIVRSRTR